MCGIFGVVNSKESNYSTKFLENSFRYLAKLSESRGKDSSGICLNNHESINIIKSDMPITELISHNKVKSLFNSLKNKGLKSNILFGHSRLVTNGSQLQDYNNQPISIDGIVSYFVCTFG